MAGQNFYLITALPGLDDLGSVPPLSRIDLLEHLADHASVTQLVRAVFLSDDLLQKQAFVTEEISELDLAVLTDTQVKGEEPLPVYLDTEECESITGLAEDNIWRCYFNYVDQIACRQGNAFLQRWVGYEVGLRNALARARAQTLQLEPDTYLVCTELADTDIDFTPMVNEWSAAATPLAGLKILDQARWNWINEHQRWFSFSDDEMIVYAVRLMLLWRWHRLNQ